VFGPSNGTGSSIGRLQMPSSCASYTPRRAEVVLQVLRPNVAVAVHCGVPETFYRERLIDLRPEGYHRDVPDDVADSSGVDGLHKLITEHFHFATCARVVFILLRRQAIRNLIARRIVANEEGAGGFVDVAALVSHVGHVADIQ
jgi:hypothetical protein